MDARLRESLRAIFEPRSVAIVGASNNPKRWGYSTMSNMLGAGYRHPVYPINPTETEVFGMPCYASLADVGAPIDLAVIAVNVAAVPRIIEDCIAAGVKGGIVITAGFAEVSAEGAELQKRLAAAASDAGFFFVGPNCWGIWSSEGNVNTVFERPLRRGHIAFLSQSGTLGEYMANAMRRSGFGISKFISCGNQASITFSDFLEYLTDDISTRVVVGYLEEVVDGGRFLRVARELSRKKPFLLYKAGTTEAAARAAFSHTAALTGDDEIFDAACRQAGVIRWHDIMEMFHMAEALCYMPLPGGNRIAVVSGGGGFCVTAAEACTRMGMELPVMHPEAQEELLAQMRGFAPPPLNPIDCIARKSNRAYLDILEIVAKQEYIDGIIFTPRMGGFDRSARPEAMIGRIQQAKDVSELPKKYGKPLVCATESELAGPVYETFKRNHIPFFNSPNECAKAMYALVEYAGVRRRLARACPRRESGYEDESPGV